MNIQKVFQAVKDQPDQPTLIVAVAALEEQGFKVTVNDKYSSAAELAEADVSGELDELPMRNGVILRISKENDQQSFRIQFLDLDAICLTDVDTAPVMYNPDFTTGFYDSGENN